MESTTELQPTDPFEVIKRQIYIRSPGGVRLQAVAASGSVRHHTLEVASNPVEESFYAAELQEGQEEARSQGLSAAPGFGTCFDAARETTCHPAASKKLQQAAGLMGPAAFGGLASFARSSLHQARDAHREMRLQIPQLARDAELAHQSLLLAEKVQAGLLETTEARRGPSVLTLMAGGGGGGGDGGGAMAGGDGGNEAEVAAEEERRRLVQGLVHAHACPEAHSCLHHARPALCGATVKLRRVAREDFQAEYVNGVGDASEYLCTAHERDGLAHYLHVTRATAEGRGQRLAELRQDEQRASERVAWLERALGAIDDGQADELELQVGAKCAALIRHVRRIRAGEAGEAGAAGEAGETAPAAGGGRMVVHGEASGGQAISCKVIVFSMWHETLKLVQAALRRHGIAAVFCDGTGHAMQAALRDFVSGGAEVLLLSASSKASGANLQVARHVVLLDPPGHSAAHGAALEQQAIGRAVRMGQQNSVTVTRICVTGTLEGTLFEQIATAAAAAATRADDTTYVCAGARRALPAPPAAVEEEVEMVSQRTVAEVVEERWQWAEARGLVVDAEEEVSPEELRRWREADAVSRPAKRQRGASGASSAAGPSSAANGASSQGGEVQLAGAAAAVKQEAGDRAAAAAAAVAAELGTSEGAAKHESKRALWKPPPSALVVDLTDD